MTVERAKEILTQYIETDLESADPGYVREILEELCTEEELEELGFQDWIELEGE